VAAMKDEDAFGDDVELFWEFGDVPGDGTIVFQLGGRLDLPDGFVVPPVRLAPIDELTAEAQATPAVARLVAFADWVGKGRRLSDQDDLTPPDAEELANVLGLDVGEWVDDGTGQSAAQRRRVAHRGVGDGGGPGLSARSETVPHTAWP